MMIQQIAPHTLDNAYVPCQAQDNDYVLLMDKADILLDPSTGKPYTYIAVKNEEFAHNESFVYLFSVDGEKYFFTPFVPQEFIDKSDRIYVRDCGEKLPQLQLAGATAMHLGSWYRSHQYCGCCGSKSHPDAKERAMKCEKCRHLAFPVICPAIIVAVTDGDRILLTRSLRHNAIFSLIAGYTEIGETLEQTAAREAMEECGVKIKNIRQYVDQPWGFSSSLMVGFFAELDGDDTVRIQESELKEAKWFTRDTMPVNENPIDITHYMMEQFRKGKV